MDPAAYAPWGVGGVGRGTTQAHVGNIRDCVVFVADTLRCDTDSSFVGFEVTDIVLCWQILFMVGMGFLKPDLANLSECPKLMKKLITECIAFKADLRPLFRQVSRLRNSCKSGLLLGRRLNY